MSDKIIYTLEIDDKNFAAVVRNANGEVVQLDKLIKKTGDDGGKSFQGLTATVRDLTVAYAGIKGAVSGVLGIFKEYIDLAGVQQSAESRLKFALKQSGDASSETFEKHKELGAELQRLTTVGDETAIKLMGLASQYGVQSDKLGDVAKGAIGLSEAFGVDLEGATKLLSGAMMGEYEMLNRLIPQMRTAKDDTERAAILNKVLANTFDYATERAKGFAGQQKQTQNNINDLKEEIGVFIRTALKPAYVFINDLSIFMKDHLALSIGIMTGVISTAAIPAFIALGTQLKAIVAEVTLATGGFNLIIPAIVAIATATTVYAATMDDGTEATKAFSKELNDLKKSMGQSTNEELKAEADKILLTMNGYDIVLAAKQKQLNDLNEKQKAANAENNQILYNKIDEEKSILQESYDYAMARKMLYIEKLQAIDNEENERAKANAEKANAEKTEAENKAAEERRKKQKELDDAIFAENQAFANEETARLKAEQDKRIADNQAFLVKQQADKDAANDEMAMREIEAVWTVAEETQKAAKAKSDAEKKAQQDKAEYQKQGLKDSLNNLQALKTLGSDAAKIAKGAAVASATIDTIDSAGKSYKWGASWGGPVGGAVMAAIAIAAGVARVAQITATGTGFQSGGYTGDVPENQEAGTVHGREFVMNAETTRRVGVSTLSAIQAGVPVSVLPSSQFAGSATSAGLNNVAGSVQALNMNMVNGAMPAPIIEINANTDLINFEIKRREASNEVDKTGRSYDNVS